MKFFTQLLSDESRMSIRSQILFYSPLSVVQSEVISDVSHTVSAFVSFADFVTRSISHMGMVVDFVIPFDDWFDDRFAVSSSPSFLPFL
jgi:hypothetical protein